MLFVYCPRSSIKSKKDLSFLKSINQIQWLNIILKNKIQKINAYKISKWIKFNPENPKEFKQSVEWRNIVIWTFAYVKL